MINMVRNSMAVVAVTLFDKTIHIQQSLSDAVDWTGFTAHSVENQTKTKQTPGL
jgi:hypothetical protein